MSAESRVCWSSPIACLKHSITSDMSIVPSFDMSPDILKHIPVRFIVFWFCVSFDVIVSIACFVPFVAGLKYTGKRILLFGGIGV